MKEEQLINSIKELFDLFLKSNNIVDKHQISNIKRNIFDSLSNKTDESMETVLISAPNAIVEVVDEKTGELFRKYLEIIFEENHNGLRLIGENLKGEQSEITFLSDSAIVKISELNGHGPDVPKCDH